VFSRQRDNLLDHLGLATGSSGKLAEARQIAASLDHGTLLERMLLYWSGEWEQADAAWTTAGDRDASAGDRLDGTINAYWAGRVRRLSAAYDPAKTTLANGLAVAVQGPQVPAELMLRAELALLAAERGQVDEGKAELARCQEILRCGEDWRGLAGRVALAAGMLAAAEDRPKEAAEAFAAAAQTFRGYACCWDEAEARCLWARALPAEAGSQREIATRLYRSIGAGHRWATWVTRSAN
jgi:hypothetical protein